MNFLARYNVDDQAKRRLMPIVRDLIQTIVIAKTPGHQPAALQVHGNIANIMASMDVIDIMQQQFVASAQNDMMAALPRARSIQRLRRKSSSRLMPRSF